MNENIKTYFLFSAVFLLIVITGFVQSWNSALFILNMGLISAVMSLGVNLQWGIAGLLNVGIMGFVGLGGLATVLVAMQPVPEAWNAGGPRILLGLIFAPFYFKSKITTLPEYLEKRYSTNSRTFLAFVAVISALLIHIGIGLYAGAQVMNDFFGIPILVSITLISVITAIYTVLGGLKAVVVTETIQTVILLLGAISLTLAAFLLFLALE